MPKRTNHGLAAWARTWLGHPYWYGCVAYKCTDELLKRKREQYPKHYTDTRMARYRADIKAGEWAADCIGLAKGYMWWSEEQGRAQYATNGCPDASADGMLAAAKVRGDIDTLPELPGIMLWKNGHVGVYIGKGYAIEARGFDWGVVETNLAGRGWKKWFRLPGCEYMAQDDGTGRVNGPFGEAKPKPAQPGDIRITGARVNIRSGPGKQYDVLRTVSAGDVLKAAANPDGWRPVVVDGMAGWVSPKYSEVSGNGERMGQNSQTGGGAGRSGSRVVWRVDELAYDAGGDDGG